MTRAIHNRCRFYLILALDLIGLTMLNGNGDRSRAIEFGVRYGVTSSLCPHLCCSCVCLRLCLRFAVYAGRLIRTFTIFIQEINCVTRLCCCFSVFFFLFQCFFAVFVACHRVCSHTIDQCVSLSLFQVSS